MELLKYGQLNGVGAGWPPPDGVYWAFNSLSSVEVGPVATLGQPCALGCQVAGAELLINSWVLAMSGGGSLMVLCSLAICSHSDGCNVEYDPPLQWLTAAIVRSNYGVVRSISILRTVVAVLIANGFFSSLVPCWLWRSHLTHCGRSHLPPETDLAGNFADLCWGECFICRSHLFPACNVDASADVDSTLA
ncbi:hypothetical protein Nepgr_033652 [Nepenthes gracilis]|uniref:Uncharacterized protein n=1 Tax=Nepenthes gracilis TaxID=150966 RepID=A0AAD3TMP1_NEPGR|nr:hypothetical protein Nepgr_033652 [Nepenthes gracilis]